MIIYGILFVFLITLFIRQKNKEVFTNTVKLKPTIENYKNIVFVDDNDVCYRYKLVCE